MNTRTVLRIATTLLLLVCSVVLVRALWRDYMYSPWTRDGRVRAKVVQIATDVSGLVSDVRVRDNEYVHQGDLLFVLDPTRFQYAIAQADAQLQNAEARLAETKARMAVAQTGFEMKRADAARRASLAGDAISDENRADAAALAKEAASAYESAAAAYAAAQAQLKAAQIAQRTAELDLTRSQVRAPADGYITNLDVYPGDFVHAGVARMALIDAHSFWVYGYFEETKLLAVQPGERAQVRLLSGGAPIEGHVESLARGIADRDNSTSSGDLLADVDPVFTWVRLAQRVPVRIHLDHVPDGIKLAMGMTCTVTLMPTAHR